MHPHSVHYWDPHLCLLVKGYLAPGPEFDVGSWYIQGAWMLPPNSAAVSSQLTLQLLFWLVSQLFWCLPPHWSMRGPKTEIKWMLFVAAAPAQG